jgi:GAF domain-containing protein
VLLGREALTVYASSEPTWEGLRVTPAMGVVGVALRGADPVVAPPDECEPPLNQVASGQVAAALPISRAGHQWGVLLVVQRRASVLLADDLALLGALCRHAADVLDHARLRHEERDRARAVGS